MAYRADRMEAGIDQVAFPTFPGNQNLREESPVEVAHFDVLAFVFLLVDVLEFGGQIFEEVASGYHGGDGRVGIRVLVSSRRDSNSYSQANLVLDHLELHLDPLAEHCRFYLLVLLNLFVRLLLSCKVFCLSGHSEFVLMTLLSLSDFLLQF